MLGQRVLTAIVLLALFIPATLATSPWPFLLLTLLMIGAAAWEWGRLSQVAPAGALLFGAAVAGTCALLASVAGSVTIAAASAALVVVLWVAGGTAALRAGPSGWSRAPSSARLVLGFVLLCIAWLGMVRARGEGVNFLLSVLSLVWVADIAAYFGGRAFGKRKLAPSISPGKSWAGVWSGLVAVLVVGALWQRAEAGAAADSVSVYGRLDARWGPVGVVVGSAFLVAMSVVGDLFESLVKRSAGVKDSSGLLPGHGGVLDRVDALLPVVPLAVALLAL